MGSNAGLDAVGRSLLAPDRNRTSILQYSSRMLVAISTEMSQLLFHISRPAKQLGVVAITVNTIIIVELIGY
jgi:hypothetical protein